MSINARVSKTLLRLAVVAATGVGFAVLSAAADAATVTTFGTKMTVMMVRAHKKGGEKMDDGIPKAIAGQLKNKYWKYKNFEKISEESREVRMGGEEQFPLDDGKVMKIKLIGYQPEKLLIKLKVQVDMDITQVSLFSTESLYFQVGTGDDTLIAVVTCTLLQQKN